MATVFMSDPATNRCALFIEPNTTGDPKDPNSPRNAPLNNPNGYLSSIYYHSDFDMLEVLAPPIPVAITHNAIPAGTASGGSAAALNGGRVYGAIYNNYTMYAHGLGYVPDFFLLSGSNIVHPGYPVQYDSADGRARCVTAYADATNIYLYEYGVQTSTVLPAVAISYSLLILVQPPAPSGSVMLEVNPTNDITFMARNKFRSDRRYMQIVGGGTPYGLPLARTTDFSNGAPRTVNPDGSIREIVPASFRVAYGFSSGYPVTYGPSGAYNGSFSGGPFILVQAP